MGRVGVLLLALSIALAACGSVGGGAAAPAKGDQPPQESSGGGRKFPMVEGTPAPGDAPVVDSVSPTSVKPGDKVVVKGKKLAPVMCALPNEVQEQPDGIPPGPDPSVWLVPQSGKPVQPFAFNDPVYTNGNVDDGEWMAEEIDFFLPGEIAPGAYRLVVKTACGFSKATPLQITPK